MKIILAYINGLSSISKREFSVALATFIVLYDIYALCKFVLAIQLNDATQWRIKNCVKYGTDLVIG